MRYQLHVYLNDDNIIDDYVIKEIKTTSISFSKLVKALLFIYFKHARKSEPDFKTADFVKLVDARLTKER